MKVLVVSLAVVVVTAAVIMLIVHLRKPRLGVDPSAPQDLPNIVINLESGREYEFIYIPPGTFKRGRDIPALEGFLRRAAIAGQGLDEGPEARVTITKGFFVSKYKVTAEQYCTFLNSVPDGSPYVTIDKISCVTQVSGEYVPKHGYEQSAADTVTWEGAVAFCEWLSRESGRQIRLPTEAEWEYTARGPNGRACPWGNNREGARWRYDLGPEGTGREGEGVWAAVDAFPENATPRGVVGMASPVGEWCSDFYMDAHDPEDVVDPQGPSQGRLAGSSSTTFHVVRRSMPLATSREPADEGSEQAPGSYGFRPVLVLDDAPVSDRGDVEPER